VASRRSKKASNTVFVIIAALVLVAVGAYFRATTGPESAPAGEAGILRAPPGVPTTPPVAGAPATESTTDFSGQVDDAEPVSLTGLQERRDSGKNPVGPPTGKGQLRTGRDAMTAGDLVTARQHLSDAYRAGLPAQDATGVIEQLTKIADETVFSPRALRDDPLTASYTIQAGDTLEKIARRHSVTAELLARVNEIKDKNRIRLGRRIKVIHGPFHVMVSKSAFTLDVFLGNTFVRRYAVGLGQDDSTPTGEWVVANKLVNPTYYPPRGGKIIAADDPANPLGERWIGLKGVKGEAAGQERYGIHGTIDPDSVGKAVSMGCIRMYNKDVEYLFDLVVTGQSRVLVQE
jgi:lipoprotein-anchoring transpeptidase ErfK/SrfK